MRDRSQNGSGALGRALVRKMPSLTKERHQDLVLDNAARNVSVAARGRSIKELRGVPIGVGDSAVIVAAGPSVKRRDPAKFLRDADYRGAVVCTDSAIYYLLRNGIVPDLVVTLDPHATRIVRWFGDPSLNAERVGADDYYRRQDMDKAFADELRVNREILDLIDKHGSEMRIALCTSASQAVVDRVLESGMQVYWWNPMLDDPDEPKSVTAELMRQNGFPCINSGGNVGTASWMISGLVLGKQRIALTGMDFGYYDDTPYRNTQYYHEIVDLVGEPELDQVFMHVHNPAVDAWFFTDPAYMWYREAMLELAADADWKTVNCTEGGILFGPDIGLEPLSEFLDKVL